MCVCVCESEREESFQTGMVWWDNTAWGLGQGKHTASQWVNTSSIFQCSDKFTPLPLCSLCAYNCLSGLTAYSGHALVEQLPQIQQKESSVVQVKWQLFKQSWSENTQVIGTFEGVICAINRTVNERASPCYPNVTLWTQKSIDLTKRFNWAAAWQTLQIPVQNMGLTFLPSYIKGQIVD